MTKTKKFSNKRKYVMRRRIAAFGPILILLSIPLLKLLNIVCLRIEYSEALFAKNTALANEIFAERAALDGSFLYNLPTFGKILVFVLLILAYVFCIFAITEPVKGKRSR